MDFSDSVGPNSSRDWPPCKFYQSDNNNNKTMSRLRPPSKVQMPSAGGLAEMSASESNARSAMAPPATIPTLKHKPSGCESDSFIDDAMSRKLDEDGQLTKMTPKVLESQSKMPRQTLAERAGQPYSAKNPAAPPSSSIRHVNGDIKRQIIAGPKTHSSFSSTHGPSSNRGLPGPGFASTTRPGAARTQSSMGHGRSKSQYSNRPASSAGHHGRTLSQSVRGEAPAQQGQQIAQHTTVNNGTVLPFLSTLSTPDVITTYNVQPQQQQRAFSLTHVTLKRRGGHARNVSDQSSLRSMSASSAATTLVQSDAGSLVPYDHHPFVYEANAVSSAGNEKQEWDRVLSLCKRFGDLKMGSNRSSNASNATQDTFMGNTSTSDDRFLMPPPPLPPNKQIKKTSSLPVMNGSYRSPSKHSPQQAAAAAANTSRARQPQSASQKSLSYVTPTRKKCQGSPVKKTPSKTPKPLPQFLTKDSLTPHLPAWTEEAIERRLKGFDDVMSLMNKQMEGTTFNQQFLKDTIESQRDQLAELTMAQRNLSSQNEALREELGELKEENNGLVMVQTEMQRNHEIEIDDLERKQRHEMEEMRGAHEREVERLRREAGSDADEVRRQHRNEIEELTRRHRTEIEEIERRFKGELEEEREKRAREVAEIARQRNEAISKIATGIGEKEREADAIRDELRQRTQDLEREKMLRASLESKFTESSANLLSLESSNSAMRAKIDFLESDNQQQGKQFADLHKRMQEAIDAAAVANAKLRAEETLRRKLHNQVQELKGNIRVFCRVRPTLDADTDPATITYPDNEDESKEIVVRGDEKVSALGKVSATNHAFNFDRVFGPASQNADVFEEISQLVQSALDGYNVCIFCYGQTGSGKTHTMSSADGMIPRAVRQIYETAKGLEEKGWTYRMQGSFVEVYNESINDLLGKAEDLDKKKHEIQHDAKRMKTTITDVEIMDLDSPDRVQDVLRMADKNRSVAATKANMRSSRSHSVFILTLLGENSITGEKCEGTLNLVDLAGSERLAHSQAEGARLKETQNINKSLSCLGDVIGALGSKGAAEGGHIPYRNSKLTYLLQYSLGGNSKTLMFVMVSPLQAHLAETLTSLKFATKVHNTHIGTAKRVSKVGH